MNTAVSNKFMKYNVNNFKYLVYRIKWRNRFGRGFGPVV